MLQRISDQMARPQEDCNDIDLTKIARPVVRSQPTRAADVPHQCSFVHRWGGGGACHFVREINSFDQAGVVPCGRQISELAFKFLATLEMPPYAQPALAVHATLLAIPPKTMLVAARLLDGVWATELFRCQTMAADVSAAAQASLRNLCCVAMCRSRRRGRWLR